MSTQSRAPIQAVRARQAANYERYQEWRHQRIKGGEEITLPLNSLRFDLQTMGEIGTATWEQFDLDQKTFLVENLKTRHTTPARYRFNGTDIVVAEAQANRPELTLRNVTEAGYQRAVIEAKADPDYEFQKQRDKLFLGFHDQVVRMMQGEISDDTLIACSSFPTELLQTPKGKNILRQKAYNQDDLMGFLYIAKRVSAVEVEFLTIRLDNCTPENLGPFFQSLGQDVPVNVMTSHQLGGVIIGQTNKDLPMSKIESKLVKKFDEARKKQESVAESYYGRDDVSINAYKFLDAHESYWVAYKAFSEQLARALNGEVPNQALLEYLRSNLKQYKAAGGSVLSADETQLMEESLARGFVDTVLESSYAKILIHSNVSLHKRLFEVYKRSGQASQLTGTAAQILHGFSNSASVSAGHMAARGEGASGCGLTLSVIESNAMQMAKDQGITIEEARRRIESVLSTEPLTPDQQRQYLIAKYGEINIKYGDCLSCGDKSFIGGCGVCGICDYRDTNDPGYIANNLTSKPVESTKPATGAEVLIPNQDSSRISDTEMVRSVYGPHVRLKTVLKIGGATKIVVDENDQYVADF